MEGCTGGHLSELSGESLLGGSDEFHRIRGPPAGEQRLGLCSGRGPAQQRLARPAADAMELVPADAVLEANLLFELVGG